MIVIADTSVLLNLELVGQLQLLQSLFGSVSYLQQCNPSLNDWLRPVDVLRD